jgi:hypothetical protein
MDHLEIIFLREHIGDSDMIDMIQVLDEDLGGKFIVLVEHFLHRIIDEIRYMNEDG